MAVVALATACAGGDGGGGVNASSGKSPFDGCGEERAAGGFVNVGSEVEPYLAFDPRDPSVLVAVYQQDRWSNGKARGIAVSTSSNGGEDWERAPLPLSSCAGNAVPDSRSGDPWVSSGPDGTMYVIAAGDGILATRSRDGGKTWSRPLSVDPGTETYAPDKPAITADPRRAGVAHAVWARFYFGEETPAVRIDATYAGTDDGGRTWSRPRVLVAHEPLAGTISSQILVGPDGDVLYHLALWEENDVPGPGAPARILVQRSVDDGRTWSEPRTPLTVQTAGYAPLAETGEAVRTGVEAPTFALDRETGTLYAAWEDSRFSRGRFNQIAFSRSGDGGRTWSRPTRVGPAESSAGVPMLAVNATGEVGLSYYTFRLGEAERSPRPIEARVWFGLSGDRGRTFTTEPLTDTVVIDDGPKSLSTSGLRGVFLGDYMGLVSPGDEFLGLYVLPEEDSADVFFFRREGGS